MPTSRRFSVSLHLLNTMTAALSIAVIALMLVPMKMKRASSTIYNPRNRTCADDSLAMEMRVMQWVNYVRSVPEAHIDVNDVESNDFCFFPPDTRLSPLMQSIGRCRMAVEIRDKGGVDADQCNRFETGVWQWTMMAASIVQLVLCHRQAKELIDSSSRATRSSSNVSEVGRSKLIVFALTVAACFNWLFVFVAFLFHLLSAKDPSGIVYTLESEIKPIACYSPPLTRDTLEWLSVSMVIILVVEFVIACLICSWFVRGRGMGLVVSFMFLWSSVEASPTKGRPFDASSSSSMMLVGGSIFIVCVVLIVFLCGGEDKKQKAKDKAFEEAAAPTVEEKQPDPIAPPHQPHQPPQQPQQQQHQVAEPAPQPSLQLDGNSIKSLIVPKHTDRTSSLASRVSRKSFTSSSAATGNELNSDKSGQPPKKGGKGKKKS